MNHPTQDQLIGFASGQVDDDGAEALYRHLAECTVCHARFRGILDVREDFEGAWSEFIGTRGLLVLAIRGLLDGARRLATAGVDRCAVNPPRGDSLEAVFVPAYGGVGDDEAAPETRRLGTQASAACSQDDLTAAAQHLEALARQDPAASESACLRIRFRGRAFGEVVVHSSRRAVSVLLYLEGLPADRGFVRFDPLETREPTTRWAELRPVEGARYLLAEFEDCPDGPFSLQLELLSHSE